MVSVIRQFGNNLVRNVYKICDHGRYCRQVDNFLPEKDRTRESRKKLPQMKGLKLKTTKESCCKKSLMSFNADQVILRITGLNLYYMGFSPCNFLLRSKQ